MTPKQFQSRREAIEKAYRERREFVDAYRDQNLAELYAESNWMQREIAAAMWSTWNRAHQKASPFWEDVISDRHDTPDDPTHLLSQELLSMYHRAPPYSNGVKVKPGKTYGLCVKAWNAYCQGRTLRKLEFNEKKEVPQVAA